MSATGAEAESLATIAQTLLVVSSVLLTLFWGLGILPVVFVIRRISLFDFDLEVR